jgi:transposase InsO family protein
LRRQRYTGAQIAAQVGVSPATVSRILQRRGLNKLTALEPAEPVRRYERDRPGELIHLDIKKLGKFNQIGHRITGDRKGQSNGRGVGWEYVHVCIDDHSRVAFAKVMPDEKKRSAIAFLKAALAYYASLGIKVERVMTDNGSCYKSFAFRRACTRLSTTSAPRKLNRGVSAGENRENVSTIVNTRSLRPLANWSCTKSIAHAAGSRLCGPRAAWP